MDTKESKTPEEQKEHIIGERVPEDFESSKPHLQPEAGGMYKLLPLVIIILGVIVVSIIVLGIINRGN